jgi:ubiquinol-cytochrome c reductase cytochrome b subunit
MDTTRSGRLLAYLANDNPASRRATALADRLRHRAQPTSWSMLWGTVSAGCFTVLLLTGVILMLGYDASSDTVTYSGGYALLRGMAMSRAFASTLHLSLDVPGGLLVRQAHHWAALILPASVLMQLTGAFFSGAHRRPRRWLWVLTVGSFLLVLVCGWSGYGLPDDNLSGTGLRIVQGTTLALPFVGTWLTSTLFGGEFPGRIIEHLYLIHLLAPAALVLVLAIKLRLAQRLGPVQVAGPGRSTGRVVGLAVWPQVATRVAGLFFITVGLVTLMAGTLTISPVWLYGPSSPANAYAGSQPDWYTAFLDGALRLVPPGWEVFLWGRTWTLALLVPLGAIGGFFGLLITWPYLEERLTHDKSDHEVLDRPRDHPIRTGLGAAGATFYGGLGLSGSADVLATQFGVSFEGVIWVLRVVVVVGPLIAFAVARTACRTLQADEEERRHHGAESGQIVRLADGGFVALHRPLRVRPTAPPAITSSREGERADVRDPALTGESR